jgi:hypothetical protein
MPMLELGSRRPKKERVSNSDEQRKAISINIFWILAACVARGLETVDD